MDRTNASNTQDLRESARYFRSAMGDAPVGITVLPTDKMLAVQGEIRPDAPFRPGSVGLRFSFYDANKPKIGCLAIWALPWLYFGYEILLGGKETNVPWYAILAAVLLAGVGPVARELFRISRRADLVITPREIHFRRGSFFSSRKYSLSREDIDSIVFFLEQSSEDADYMVGLQLRSGAGEMDLVNTGKNREKARYIASALRSVLHLPVTGNTPIALSEMAWEDCRRHNVDLGYGDLPVDRAHETERKKPAAADAAALMPPRDFDVFTVDAPEYAMLVARAGLEDEPGIEDKSAFAVRRSLRTLGSVLLALPLMAIVLYFVVLDPEFPLWNLEKIFTRGAWPVERLLPAILQLTFAAGAVVAFFSIPHWILGKTWYVFLPGRMIVCEQSVRVRHTLTLDRDELVAARWRRNLMGKKQWLLELLRSGDAPFVLLEDPKRGIVVWLSGVITSWLGRG